MQQIQHKFSRVKCHVARCMGTSHVLQLKVPNTPAQRPDAAPVSESPGEVCPVLRRAGERILAAKRKLYLEIPNCQQSSESRNNRRSL